MEQHFNFWVGKMLFLWAIIIKIHIGVMKNTHLHLWKISHLAFNTNHSLLSMICKLVVSNTYTEVPVIKSIHHWRFHSEIMKVLKAQFLYIVNIWIFSYLEYCWLFPCLNQNCLAQPHLSYGDSFTSYNSESLTLNHNVSPVRRDNP